MAPAYKWQELFCIKSGWGTLPGFCMQLPGGGGAWEPRISDENRVVGLHMASSANYAIHSGVTHVAPEPERLSSDKTQLLQYMAYTHLSKTRSCWLLYYYSIVRKQRQLKYQGSKQACCIKTNRWKTEIRNGTKMRWTKQINKNLISDSAKSNNIKEPYEGHENEWKWNVNDMKQQEQVNSSDFHLEV